MAYKLVCTHEFHDHHTGRVIKRGEEVYDYNHIAKLVHGANGHIPREHHFRRAAIVMEADQWEWPPKLGGRDQK